MGGWIEAAANLAGVNGGLTGVYPTASRFGEEEAGRITLLRRGNDSYFV